jgi:predicted DNA-binding antitoxin AbrB/MazE fold protein
MVLVCSQIAGMKTLTIRGVPEELHERLRQRARQNRRSLNQEIIAELTMIEGDAKNFAGSGLSKAAYFLERSDQLQSGVIKPLTAVEISQGIKEDRR